MSTVARDALRFIELVSDLIDRAGFSSQNATDLPDARPIRAVRRRKGSPREAVALAT